MAGKATTAKAKTSRKATTAKATGKAKPSARARRLSASAARPARRRIVETTTFRHGRDGSVFRMDLKTRPVGKVITAKVGGKVKAIAISR